MIFECDFDIENCDSHVIKYGHIIDNNEIIDEVLVMIMRSPKTYTTEDIVEINGGSTMTLSTVYKLKVSLADAMALYNLIEGDGSYNAAADLDKDTELTLNDFLALYDYLSGVKDYEDIVALQ